ncbi:MAG: peptidylprolyl isomerase [Deltaproteobacteria bacterium]|jgi:parvulin-like peptidyl-prolyl isomerase|nr:peptidylprolyl isomerase [Deltaproteobacteria bacterium]MBP6829406.1 peptidylprolyl isomerase [Deltaproteobacteria bacterium]
MLEGFRKHSNSFFLIVLIASVATIFGVGPGSQSCSQGSLKVTYAAKVHGRTLSESDFVAAVGMVPRIMRASEENPAVVGAIRQGALDGLIERELLAHEAERLGMRVTEEMVNEEFRNCRFYASVGVGAEPVLGVQSGRVELPPSSCGGVGDRFDFPQFERVARRLFRRTVADLRESMVREMLAQRMRDSVRASVQLSDEDMWRDYQRSHDQMAVRYLRYNLNFYRNLVRDDDAAQVEAWAGQHTDEIQRQWERRRESLRGLRREFRSRHILVKYPEGATDAQKAEVRARAEAIRAQLVAGGDFVRLARLYSDDPGNWREGGMLPWTAVEGSNFDAAFVRAATALQPNGVSPVTETPFGAHIIQLLAFREGDVPEAEAKRDIARTLFRETRGAELAREAARATLERMRTATNLDEVGTQAHAAALREFFRGEVPGPVTLANNVTLTPVERTDLDAPTLQDSEVFARNGFVVNDVERAEMLTSIAFGLTQESPLVREPVQAGDDWFLMRFKDGSRTVATREEFGRQRQELLSSVNASALAARQRDVLVQYVTHLRQEAEHDGQVRIGNSPRLRAPAPGQEDN